MDDVGNFRTTDFEKFNERSFQLFIDFVFIDLFYGGKLI